MNVGASSRVRFFLTFDAALGLHSFAVAMAIQIENGPGVRLIMPTLAIVLGGVFVMRLWAALAPRTAVCVLATLLTLSMLRALIWIRLDHQSWFIALVACELVAMVLAARAFRLAELGTADS